MKKNYLMGMIFFAFLAFLFTSCAGKKPIVKEDETLASDLDAARARISDLEGEIKTKDQTIQDLEMQITAKNEEISDLQGELAMSEQEARDLEIQIVSREEEIAALEESMSTLQVGGEESAAIAQLNNRRIALERDVDSLQEQLDEANSRNADLEAEIAGLQDENASLQDELADIEAMRERDRDRMTMTRDELIASLEQEIEEKTIEIQQYKDALTINIVDQLFFDSGKADIKKEGLDVLDRIAEAIKGLEDKVIRIEGHTDDVPIGQKIRGKFPSNWELGAARSSAVVRYFIDKHDIDPSQCMAVSYSKYRPVVPNISEENRSKNRRIEIVLTQRALYEMMEIEESSIVQE
jgi:chemotaxis protein MotB